MASSGPISQSTTHDMGRPSGKTRPQAQAQRSTVQISAPELSAEPEKIQSPEKRKNEKTRSAQRRAEPAAIGESTDSDFATLTPEMDTVEVPTSDNEPREKNRKRNRGSAPVAEEEGALLGMFHVEGEHLHAIHLDYRNKRRRIGSALMNEVERTIAQTRPRAVLEVRAFNTGAFLAFSAKSIVQYSSLINAWTSRSRSTISRNATVLGGNVSIQIYDTGFENQTDPLFKSAHAPVVANSTIRASNPPSGMTTIFGGPVAITLDKMYGEISIFHEWFTTQARKEISAQIQNITASVDLLRAKVRSDSKEWSARIASLKSNTNEMNQLLGL